MANETKETIILDFQIEQGDAIGELEKTKKAIIQLKEEQQQLNKAYKDANITVEEYAAESVRLEGILKKETASYNNLSKVVQSTNNSLEAQRIKLAQLVDQRNKVDRSTEQGVKKFNDLNKSIKDLNDQIKKAEQAGGDFRRNVGNYTSALEGFAGQVNVGGVSLGDLTGKMAAFVNPATAAAGAVSALAGLYISSAAGARDLESAQTQLSQSFTTIGNDLAKLLGADGQGGGLLSRLATAFNTAVFGLGSSVRGNLAAGAQQALKELELAEINAKAVAKRALDEAERFRRLRDDDTKSLEERKKAAEQVLGFINVREQALVNVQKDRITQLKIQLSLDKDNLNLQKEVRLAELELADILEDSQGKRTEALNGINNLRKEEVKIAAENNAALAEELRLKSQLEQVNARLEGQTITNIESLKEQSALIKGNSAAAMKGAQEILAKNIEKGEKERALAKQQQDIDRLVTQQKLANASMVLGQVNNLLEEESFAYKSFAIAQATIDTIRAATAALAPPPVGVGPFLGPILAATTSALGLANIAKIAGVGFSEGGYTGDGGKYEPAGVVHKGEVVFNQRDVAMMGGPQRVNALRPTFKGYAEGGIVTAASTAPINQAFAFRSESSAPVIVASWKEATELNTRIQMKEALVTV